MKLSDLNATFAQIEIVYFVLYKKELPKKMPYVDALIQFAKTIRNVRKTQNILNHADVKAWMEKDVKQLLPSTVNK